MALSSCGWTLAEVHQAPIRPGRSDKLYIFGWAQYTDDELLRNFKAQTGIEAIANVYDSNEVMLAKVRAGGGSEYSIIYPSDYMVKQMVKIGLLSRLDHAKIVGLDSLFPQFQNPTYDPGNRYSVPVSWGTTGLVYNADKLKPAPTDWDYLWQHRQQLINRVTLLSDVREVMGAVLRSLGYSYNSTDPQQLKQAYQKLVELKPAIASFTSDAWRNQILTGDLLIAMSYSPDAIEVTEENPRLKYVIPQSGTSVWTDTMVIPKTAPNPDGAYAWINYVLQPSVAAQFCKRLHFATPNQAVFDQLPVELRNNPSLFPPDSQLAQSERIAPLWDFTEVYEHYWTQLTSS